MPWRFLLATAVISLVALYIGHSVSLRTIVAVVAGGGRRVYYLSIVVLSVVLLRKEVSQSPFSVSLSHE